MYSPKTFLIPFILLNGIDEDKLIIKDDNFLKEINKDLLKIAVLENINLEKDDKY